MPNYVLTGAPGAGKTAILRQLERDGCQVVEEAATDVIALEHALGRPDPSACPGFVDKIVELQRRRQLAAAPRAGGLVFFDRSPVCTLALSRYLGRPESAQLVAEVERVLRAGLYESTVFFVQNLGFVTPTAARRISLADSLVFEEVHRLTYTELGFRFVEVSAGPLAVRAGLVCRAAGLSA
jgi:predicted ATPase